MMSGGHKMDIDLEGAVPNYKFVCNKPESEFLTGEVEYCRSHECLDSWLLLERSLLPTIHKILISRAADTTDTCCYSELKIWTVSSEEGRGGQHLFLSITASQCYGNCSNSCFHGSQQILSAGRNVNLNNQHPSKRFKTIFWPELCIEHKVIWRFPG